MMILLLAIVIVVEYFLCDRLGRFAVPSVLYDDLNKMHKKRNELFFICRWKTIFNLLRGYV